MDRIIGNFGNAITEMLTNGGAFFVGIMAAVIGYFTPIKDAVHIIFFFFVLDVVFGFLAARKEKPKTKFRTKIIWNKTIPKMLVAFLLVITAHMLDEISPGGIVTIRQSVGWFVAGLVLTSVWKNMLIVTEWHGIRELLSMLIDKIKAK